MTTTPQTPLRLDDWDAIHLRVAYQSLVAIRIHGWNGNAEGCFESAGRLRLVLDQIGTGDYERAERELEAVRDWYLAHASGGRSTLDDVQPQRDAAYLTLLRHGTDFIRSAAHLGDAEFCAHEANHLHNIPHTVGHSDPSLHRNYLRFGRQHYLAALIRSRAEEHARFMFPAYAPAWEILAHHADVALEWPSEADFAARPPGIAHRALQLIGWRGANRS